MLNGPPAGQGDEDEFLVALSRVREAFADLGAAVGTCVIPALERFGAAVAVAVQQFLEELEEFPMAITKCAECGLPYSECETQSAARAYELLWEHLTLSQRYTMWWKGVFIVPDVGWAPSAGKATLDRADFAVALLGSYGMYRLGGKTGASVQESYCALPYTDHALHFGDLLLAQKLWLESDAPTLLHIAHKGGCRYETSQLSGGTNMLRSIRQQFARPARPAELRPSERSLVRHMNEVAAQIDLGSVLAAAEEERYWQEQPLPPSERQQPSKTEALSLLFAD